MVKLFTTLICLSFGQAGMAQEAFGPNRLTCELFGILSADPDVLNETATAYIEGAIAGLTSLGYGERADIITTLDQVCRDDPTLTFGKAIAKAYGK